MNENPIPEESIGRLSAAFQEVKEQMRQVIVGQDEVIEQLIIALFSRGHVLLEGVPGLAKTLMISTLAKSLSLSFSRIQFTPDLMPADITGTEVLQENKETGKREFRFLHGPIFHHMVLADEINRTPPKTQAALLEAMQERHVSVGQNQHLLNEPFFVMATQNPIEQEGTYPLPEAQLDRFIFKLEVPFLSQSELNEVVNRTILKKPVETQKVLDGKRILELRSVLEKVVVAEPIRDYAVRLVLSTHPGTDFANEDVRQFIRWGASPRAAQALIRAGRVRALSEGRAHISYSDIRHFAVPVLQHRMLLNYDGQAENISVAFLVEQCIKDLKEDV